MQEKNKWVVSTFYKDHNHKLISSPSKIQFLSSHKHMSDQDKEFIKALDDQNISSSQIMATITAQRGGLRNVGFTRKDLSNHLSYLHSEFNGIDISSTIRYFMHLQSENPLFYYAVQVDSSNMVTNLFWIDGRSRMAYEAFGDVVTFDTTYMTNKYSMPFAPFIGLNHHLQSVLFGCALIRNESADSFVWILETWLDAMFGKHPKAILIDQDPAMKKAIEKVLPNTVYRFCKWHILKKAREHFGDLYGTKVGFQQDLYECIEYSASIEEFEDRWESIRNKYELQKNSYLDSLYKIRYQWAPVFLKDTFFANMCFTQRSEGMNKVFKDIVDSHTSIHQFVIQYEKAIESLYDREEDEDFRSVQGKPSLWSQYPIEKHAREIYTRTMFKAFREQLKLTTSYDMEEINGMFKLTKIEYLGKSGVRRAPYVVNANPSEVAFSCTCKLFEVGEILCAHTLKVLIHFKVHCIPSHYILKRWTKDAKVFHSHATNGKEVVVDLSIKLLRFNALCKKMLKLSNEASTSMEIYEYANNQIDMIINEMISMKHNILEKSGDNEVLDTSLFYSHSSQTLRSGEEFRVNDPPQSQCKGQRKPQRFINPLEYQAKKPRTCGKYHGKGHNIRTCKTVVHGRRDLNYEGHEDRDDISEGHEDDYEERRG